MRHNMVKEDFIISAERHLCACKYLQDEYIRQTKESVKKRLFQEIYYLSGYVVETMMSYAILVVKQCKGNVYEDETYNGGKFKTHHLEVKANWATVEHGCDFSTIEALTQIHRDNKLGWLYRSWSADVRYENTDLTAHGITFDDVIRYIVNIDNFKKEISKKYRS